jgi:hypothetical protein
VNGKVDKGQQVVEAHSVIDGLYNKMRHIVRPSVIRPKEISGESMSKGSYEGIRAVDAQDALGDIRHDLRLVERHEELMPVRRHQWMRKGVVELRAGALDAVEVGRQEILEETGHG